ncbi:hypothetical protein [Paenibacillus macerans]|uniref:hypothetical protein n=1 Tax=Paenibacillus macerans TaxID=44252 RepID=UPI003D31D9BE
MLTRADGWVRGVGLDLKVHKQPIAWLTLLVFALYVISIVLSDPARPRNVYYFSEMGMFPVAVMVTVLLFQREIGGGGMEVIATYPVSLRLLAWRKWLLAILLTAGLDIVWMGGYRWRFGTLATVRYPWNGAEAIPKSEMSMLALLLQTLPAFILLISLTVAGIVAFRKIYGGLILGFGVWVLDTISSGELLGRWTLYTAYLQKWHSFPLNRMALLAGSLLLLAYAVWLIGRRERWISVEEE